jgi:hypothetical protein
MATWKVEIENSKIIQPSPKNIRHIPRETTCDVDLEIG